MFIYSAKMDKKKLLTLLACGGIAVLVLVLVLCRGVRGRKVCLIRCGNGDR